MCRNDHSRRDSGYQTNAGRHLSSLHAKNYSNRFFQWRDALDSSATAAAAVMSRARPCSLSLVGHLCKSAAKFSITPRAAHQANIKRTSAEPSHNSSGKQKNEFYWLDNRITLSPANPHKRSARPRRLPPKLVTSRPQVFLLLFSTLFPRLPV